MTHPYQIVCVCDAPRFGDSGFLLAACGAKIISVNLQDGSVVSQWPPEAKISVNENNPESDAPPGKKRKLEKAEATSSTVIKLALSSDQLHAVAVTGDDKCIRVFEIAADGTLTELSQRCMPKRPCAILVTPDNQNILCGDKFGDVYSLPLLPNSSAEDDGKMEVSKSEETASAKAFVPTATNLTVHTGRNRRALENQLRQKDLHAKSKEPLKFEHQLLLGHVSMLTDVKHATQDVNGRTRNFIITADRDEHIRISRAAPQAHVIERYCLGHTEYISKLCLVPESDLIVSGGGDDWLGIWDWTSGDLRAKIDVKSAFGGLLEKSQNQAEGDAQSHVAVSGLWAARDSESGQTVLLIASEKVPAIVLVAIGSKGSGGLETKTIELPGNPLDVAIRETKVIFSLDTSKSSTPRLRAYTLHQTASQPTLEADDETNGRLQKANSLHVASAPADDVLYGIANMRKRDNEEAQEEA